MDWLIRVFGPPHELLHLLALWLVGRRAVAFTWTHVDIPPDLSLRQYLFVAGLPALVFWCVAAVGMNLLLNAQAFTTALSGFALLSLGTLAGLGTLGDMQLILMRLLEARQPPDDPLP